MKELSEKTYEGLVSSESNADDTFQDEVTKEIKQVTVKKTKPCKKINVGGLKKRGKRTLEYTVYEKISMNKIAKLNKESER